MELFARLAKAVWLVLEPTNALIALAFLALLLRLAGRRKTAIALGSLAAAGAIACGFGPVGRMLLVPLEQRFPPPDLGGRRIDGIIVLGGAADSRLSAARGQLVLHGAAERYVAFADLARRYPEAKLVVSGGVSLIAGTRVAEAAVIRDHAAALGLDPARLALDETSIDTWQNAVRTRELGLYRPGETWLLVTSAWHMPRSVGVFRMAGFQVVPYPVDYWTAGEADRFEWNRSAAQGFGVTDVAAKEWVGMLAYWLAGRQQGLFPAP
jgi:uncharacterized SAM-binding protein YcdF (DUF218 family)